MDQRDQAGRHRVMEWQERLRQIDARTAAGEITPAEQRRLRDEILAEASGTGTPRLAGGPRWQAPPPATPPHSTPYSGAHVEGHAVFAAADTPRRTWIGALVVLLVLAIAAAVVWWVAAKDDTDTATTSTGLGVERLPNPARTPLSTVGEFTVIEGLEHKILQAHEADLLQQAGISQVAFRTAVDGPLTYQLFLFQTDTDAGADRLRTGIGELGEKGGMVAAEVDGLPAGVTVTKSTTGDAVVMQAIYVTDGGAVRIFLIRQAGGKDDAGLAEAMADTVRATTAELPVRTG